MSRNFAGQQALLRTLDGRAIVDVLAARGPQTHAELIAATGLSRAAVASVLRMLKAAGVVDAAGRGFTLHSQLGLAAAVHVTQHAVDVVLVDPAGTVRAEAHAPLPYGDDRAEVIAGLIESAHHSLKAPVLLAVVGVAGIVASNGGIRDDLGPDGGAFHSALTARLGLPVRIENEVNLAALAEAAVSPGRDLSSFALLLLGDGFGAGFVIDGALHRGSSGTAGVVMYLPQPPLPIGAPLLNDAVISDLALTHGRDPDATLGEHLEAAAQGDEAALEMVAVIARRILLVAGTVTLVLDPEAFILGGLAAHPVLVDAIEADAAAFAAQLAVRFLTSSFGPEAPLVGAASEAASGLRDLLFDRIVPRR